MFREERGIQMYGEVERYIDVQRGREVYRCLERQIGIQMYREVDRYTDVQRGREVYRCIQRQRGI